MRPRGHARVSPRSPAAFAICDRCGALYNHVDLQWQFDWAGSGLINKRILVCRRCTDAPQQQLRAYVLSADPIPIMNPRVQDYDTAEANSRATTGAGTLDPVTGLTIYQPNTLVTSASGLDGDTRATQLVGEAPGSKNNNSPGLDINAIQPLLNQTHYGVILPVISIVTSTTVLTATCSSIHNLTTNNIVAIEGGGNNLMDGFFSVTVTGATSFTWQPAVAVPNPGPFDPSLLQPTTLFKTAYVGLPRGMLQVPSSGVIF